MASKTVKSKTKTTNESEVRKMTNVPTASSLLPLWKSGKYYFIDFDEIKANPAGYVFDSYLDENDKVYDLMTLEIYHANKNGDLLDRVYNTAMLAISTIAKSLRQRERDEEDRRRETDRKTNYTVESVRIETEKSMTQNKRVNSEIAASVERARNTTKRDHKAAFKANVEGFEKSILYGVYDPIKEDVVYDGRTKGEYILDISKTIVRIVARTLQTANGQLPEQIKHVYVELNRYFDMLDKVERNGQNVKKRLLKSGPREGMTIYETIDKRLDKATVDAMEEISSSYVNDLVQTAAASILTNVKLYNKQNKLDEGFMNATFVKTIAKTTNYKSGAQTLTTAETETTIIREAIIDVKHYIKNQRNAHGYRTISRKDKVTGKYTSVKQVTLEVSHEETRLLEEYKNKYGLSEKDVEILRLSMCGFSTYEIAERLNTSESRIRQIRNRVSDKVTGTWDKESGETTKVKATPKKTNEERSIKILAFRDGESKPFAEFNSIGQAAKELNVDKSNISRIINSEKYKTVKGYTFKKVVNLEIVK